MWGDFLDSLKPSDLRITPGVAMLRDHILLAQGGPSNQQILDAAKRLYGRRQDVVDTTTCNGLDVRTSRPDYVARLNSHNWQNKQLTQAQRDETSNGIFGDTGGNGLFGPALDKIKASNLFSTIGVGVSADVCFGVGGFAGLGCAWDIAKRESPKGYGYATLELGIRAGASISLQVPVFNKLPSELNTQIYGLVCGLVLYGGLALSMFWTGMAPTDESFVGFAPAIGVGVEGGAAVFGGQITSFG